MADRAAILRAMGEGVRTARASAGLSQEALGDAAGLHRTYIGGIERGERNPSIVSLVRIAQACETTVSQILRRRL